MYMLCDFQNLFETIRECKFAVDESIQKQVDHREKIVWNKNSTNKLKKTHHLAITRIEKFRPFEVHKRIKTFLRK